MTTVVLVTGANKGIGRGFVAAYLSRPNHHVFAAVRDGNPNFPGGGGLADLPRAERSQLSLLTIDSASEMMPLEAVQVVRNRNFQHIDIIIANAGIAAFNQPVATLDFHNIKVTFGPVRLFQAMLPLLKASKNPKFVVISSWVSSTAKVALSAPFGIASYGASKAAVNHLVRRAHFENEWLTAFVLHLGAVGSDMGAAAVEALGPAAKHDLTVEESVKAQTKVIDQATRESISENGGFHSYDGNTIPY